MMSYKFYSIGAGNYQIDASDLEGCPIAARPFVPECMTVPEIKGFGQSAAVKFGQTVICETYAANEVQITASYYLYPEDHPEPQRENVIKELESAETDKYSLCVFECSCGFHIGIDSSYLLQVGRVDIICPSCRACIEVEGES